MQELDSKDDVQTRVMDAMTQIRKGRKRLVGYGVLGGVLVAGAALFLALGNGPGETALKTLPAAELTLPNTVLSVQENPVSSATPAPLDPAPTCTDLALKTASCTDSETPGTPSVQSLDDRLPLQTAMSSDPQPDAAAESSPDPQPDNGTEQLSRAVPEPQPAISTEAPRDRAPAKSRSVASKPKKAKHASSKAKRHSPRKRTYITYFPERQNYHYGFPAISN